jgi:hypothetical protein
MLTERLGPHPRDRPEEVRAVHRPRPDAGAHRPVRAPVRHAQLRGARRLLLGEHGRRHDLHGGRQLLGIRRPGPGPREAVRDDRHGRGPPQQPDEDRDGQVQARGRPLHLDQPGAHRLFRHRRRMDPDPARHRRRAVHGAAARADPHRPRRPAFLQRFTNAPQLVVLDEGEREGLFAFDPAAGPPGDGRNPHNKLAWDLASRPRAGLPGGHRRRLRPGAGGPLHAGRRHPRRAGSSSCCAIAWRSCTPEWAAQITGIPADRIRQLAASWARPRCTRPSSCPSPGPTPGASGTPPRRTAGGLPCDARTGSALQRLPDGARAGRADERAGHDRRARRLSAQGAVPAPHRAQLPRLQRPGHDPAEHAAERRAAGLSRRARTNWRCTPTARRCASTTPSRGSTRCRRTA